VSLHSRNPLRALVPLIAACTLSLAAPAGCGQGERPPPLGNFVENPTAGNSGSAPVFDFDAAPYVPMCSLGPEGGVCACADEPLVVDAPNLYFVLDRSGSMAQLGKWTTVRRVLMQLVIALGARAKVGVAVFPDPAFPVPASNDSCATGLEVFAPEQGDAPAGTFGPTEARLASLLAPIPAAGGTPTAKTLTKLLPRLKSLSSTGKTYVILATDGGPNCNSFATCGADTCTLNIDQGSTCMHPTGVTSCCTDPNGCLDQQPTIDAVQQIASAGVPVYVVGIPGSQPYADLLDNLAIAGGTPRTDEPRYYAVDTADQAALLTALSGIAAQITGTCTLSLNNAPPSPGLVNVFLDEKALPQAGPNGWTLDGTTVTILGVSCQKILGGGVLDIRVVAGCPTVTL
jgi:hypothetical protein